MDAGNSAMAAVRYRTWNSRGCRRLSARFSRRKRWTIGCRIRSLAEEVMRRLDPDYDKGRFAASQIGLGAVVRAKVFDDWAREFLADHPDAVVMHLGCGLDARVFRIDPPETVDW